MTLIIDYILNRGGDVWEDIYPDSFGKPWYGPLKRKEKSRDQTESLKWTREKNRNSNANDRFLLDTNS